MGETHVKMPQTEASPFCTDRTAHTTPRSAAASCNNNTTKRQRITGREVAVYSISCKCATNIDITLRWLTAHAKKG